jgi:hypothetical protein
LDFLEDFWEKLGGFDFDGFEDHCSDGTGILDEDEHEIVLDEG